MTSPRPRDFKRKVDVEAFAAKASNEFERLFYTHSGRRMRKWHHYLEVYDRHIGRMVAARENAQPLRLLEIGVSKGGSLELWRRYLGPEAIIFGIDIDPACIDRANGNGQVRIGSQADPTFLAHVIEEMGGIDIVVDDGSHVAGHQSSSFNFLFPELAADGLYICEDLHTSYWPSHDGGLKRRGTFLELVKDMIDWLHEWYLTDADRVQFKDVHGFTSSVFGIFIFDSIVVIEKRHKEKPFHIPIGGGKR